MGRRSPDAARSSATAPEDGELGRGGSRHGGSERGGVGHGPEDGGLGRSGQDCGRSGHGGLRHGVRRGPDRAFFCGRGVAFRSREQNGRKPNNRTPARFARACGSPSERRFSRRVPEKSPTAGVPTNAPQTQAAREKRAFMLRETGNHKTRHLRKAARSAQTHVKLMLIFGGKTVSSGKMA